MTRCWRVTPSIFPVALASTLLPVWSQLTWTKSCALFDGFEAVLAQASMTMGDLVWVQVFSPDLSLWDRFNAAYLRRFSKDLPARAFIGSGPLLKGGRFEMMGIARK